MYSNQFISAISLLSDQIDVWIDDDGRLARARITNGNHERRVSARCPVDPVSGGGEEGERGARKGRGGWQ